MVADRLADGVRIAQLLASEVTGNESGLRGLTVVDADADVEPTTDGALAYRIAREPPEPGGDATAGPVSGEVVAEVYVQPDRARIEAIGNPDAAATAATEAGLRVRPKAVRPPRTLAFVEDGAQVKRALAVLEAVRGDLDDERRR
jgi:hypothetical protein